MTSVLSLLLSGTPLKAAEPLTHQPEIEGPVHSDVSRPMREVSASPSHAGNVQRPRPRVPQSPTPTSGPDSALQQAPGTEINAAPATSFGGVGSSGAAPPDTNLAVGPNHVVQWVNLSFAIYDKAGVIFAGYPKAGNALWSGFGGPCETRNDGDPIVQYDSIADRWVMSQLANTSGPTFYQCFAVSQSPDPTGAYFRYAYTFSDLNDYPKIGIWPSAFFASYNMFHPIAGGLLGYTFQGSKVCAYDRNAMLSGSSGATSVCFQLSSSFGGLLPSDFDGGAANPPPAGSPNFFMNLGTNSLNLWKFTPNFSTPSSSNLAGPTNIPVSAFSQACNGGGTCIPQIETTQQLDSLADRLMYRLVYRNFGDHESIVANHSVTAGSSVGVRWYEIRSPNGTPTVYQQGTYAPDANYRWMGSIAMDKTGNIGLGYSTSGSSMHPSIRYTGRQPGDPLGLMNLAEQSIVEGTGSQLASLDRWGDYSAMRIDPSDDCTFWYTTEYLAANGTFNWKTQIASFKFASCGGTPTPDFTISASPNSQTVTQGTPGNFTINTTALNGFAGVIALSASVSPANSTITPTFNPPSLNGSGSSALSVGTNANTTPGTYTITIIGTSGSLVHSTSVTLVVNPLNPPASANFSISATPSSRTVARGGSSTYSVVITPQNSFAGSVSLNVSGLPSRSSGSFSPNPVTVSGSAATSTLTVKTNKRTPTGSFPLTITGTSGSLNHSTTVTLVVQ